MIIAVITFNLFLLWRRNYFPFIFFLRNDCGDVLSDIILYFCVRNINKKWCGTIWRENSNQSEKEVILYILYNIMQLPCLMMHDVKQQRRYRISTHQKFEVWDQKKCLDMWHSSINPNLYVDYGNMIHFAVTAPASEGWLNMGRIYH